MTGKKGVYKQFYCQENAMNVLEFKQLAESPAYNTPPHFDYKNIKNAHWKTIKKDRRIYGADVPGSLFDDDVEEFNIQRLNIILDIIKNEYGRTIEGINTPYLYFGMWKTSFAWHTEDMDLYSINYLHFGAPKLWYVVSPEHGRRLESLTADLFPKSSAVFLNFYDIKWHL